MWEYLRPLQGIKKYVKFSKKKYLTLLPQRIACYLTAYFDEKSPFERVVHFEVFNVHKKSPRLNTPFPNAWSEKRKIQAQNDRAPTKPTQNPSTYTVVSLEFTKNSIYSYTNSYNSAMTVIAQDDHLTAGAWAACVQCCLIAHKPVKGIMYWRPTKQSHCESAFLFWPGSALKTTAELT